jgi:hypothetical protein
MKEKAKQIISVGYLTSFFLKKYVIPASPETPAYGRQAYHVKFVATWHGSIDQ